MELEDFLGNIDDLAIGNRLYLCRWHYGTLHIGWELEVKEITKTLIKFTNGTREKKNKFIFILKTNKIDKLIEKKRKKKEISDKICSLKQSDISRLSLSDLEKIDEILNRNSI